MKKHIRTVSLAVFALSSLSVFIYFFMELFNVVFAIKQLKPLVVVHDGAYYLLLGLLMPYIFLVEMLAPLYKGKIVEKLVPYILFGIVITGFILPWILSPIMKSVLQENGYFFCGNLSTTGTKSRFDAWVTDISLCSSAR